MPGSRVDAAPSTGNARLGVPLAPELSFVDYSRRKARNVSQSSTPVPSAPSAKDALLRSLFGGSVNYFLEIIESINDALFIHDAPTGKPLYVNRRMLEMYGYTFDEVLQLDATTLSASVGLYTQQQSLEWMRKARADGPQTFEWLARHRSGRTFWVEVSLRFAVIENAERFIATVRDIDQRKHMEDALERRLVALTRPLDDADSQLDFTDLFNVVDVQQLQDAFATATGVASIITHPDGTPITKPSNFCYLCEHIIRKTEKGLLNCQHSDAQLGRARLGGPLMQPCLSGGLWDGGTSIHVGDRHVANWLIGQVLDDAVDEARLLAYAREIDANEQEFSAALKQVPRMPLSQFQKVCEALHVFALQLSTLAYQNVQQARDIAERRRAAEEKARLEEQLRQSQKMESVGRLAGGIAHDFNNLLVPIMGYTEMLLDEVELDVHHRQPLEEVLEAARRSRDLVQQLLAFGRKQVLKLQVVDLRAVLARFESLLRRAIRENVRVNVRLGPQAALVLADPGQLEQIIMNLAVNAQDAMPDGGDLDIELSHRFAAMGSPDSTSCKPPQAVVCLTVRDTGMGMDERALEHLFEPFFTTKPLGRGTGLGLATVYGIVEQHGGHVSVESSVGTGTTFTLLFPTAASPLEGLAIARQSYAPPKSGGRESLIVMEDDPQVRALLVAVLTARGYRVTAPANSKDCCDLVAAGETRFDALVTDVIMPDMDGKSLHEHLLTYLPTLPVLYVSGYDRNVITKHGVLDGRVHFLQKPFTGTQLATKIREVLAQSVES